MRFALLAGALALAGCVTEYRYTPPAGKTGRACIERCVQRQLECRQVEQDRSAAANARCEHDAEIEYGACLQYAEDRNKCSRRACYDYASTAQCDVDYRACYQNCGGKVEILK